MANEYQLSYTASEIDEKLGKVSQLETQIANLDVKPDWNQNDENAKDYIKNRPFWTSDEVENTCLIETSVFIGEWESEPISTRICFEEGKTYTVRFSYEKEDQYYEEEYQCVAKYAEDWDTVYIGNGNLVGESTEDTEPFACNSYSFDGNWGEVYLNTFEPGEYHIEIYGETNYVHRIDQKYMPESILLLLEESLYAIDSLYDKIDRFEWRTSFYHNLPSSTGGVFEFEVPRFSELKLVGSLYTSSDTGYMRVAINGETLSLPATCGGDVHSTSIRYFIENDSDFISSTVNGHDDIVKGRVDTAAVYHISDNNNKVTLIFEDNTKLTSLIVSYKAW